MFKLSLCAILSLITYFPTSAFENELLELHNKKRSFKGIGPLVMDINLNKYAQKHAEWMANNRSLRHSNIKNLLKNHKTVGENIAYGYTTEQKVMDGWLSSRGHRANILNSKFAYAGFGMAKSKNGTIYWCVVFGGPKPVQLNNINLCNLMNLNLCN